MDFSNVNLQIENKVAYVTIQHPPANTLNTATLHGIKGAMDYVAKDSEVKVVVVTGAGKFFIAGADIKEFTEAFQNKEKGKEMAELGQRIFDQIESMEKPVIAAINGAALGGGLELALACHLRYATEEALLGLPELKLGLIPGFGGTQRLARVVGKGKALELILSSKFIKGTEAEKLGLVNQVFPQESLLTEVKAFAESLANEKSAVSMAYAIQAVTYGLQTNQEEGLNKEADLFGDLFLTEDTKEGIHAFIEKRNPVFNDK
ncbi:MAG TPA: enoyl-CoA hydratase [Paenibacillaceae bacterium]|nr:enoyl-CoA hydratase [Paenibacillaceae bacterium]